MESERLGVIDEIHRPARKRFPHRRVQIRGINDTWQADLVDLKSRAKSNKGYSYILFVINNFTKFLWGVPLKTKGGQEVTRAMEQILSTTTPPKNLQVDSGTEFYNVHFQGLMKKYKIHLYSTFSVLKASIVERVNRTIKGAIFKNFTINGNQIWIKDLQSIVDRYNNTVHRTIRMKPKDVTSKHEKRLLRTVYRETKRAGKARFKVGDSVRISKYKNIFEKSYTPNWGTEVFTIERRQPTNPATYILKDARGRLISGGFYEQELQKSKFPDVFLVEKVLRKKGDKELVKWLGFDQTHNSWIDV